MNILFLSSVFPDATAPSRGTYNLDLCRALSKDHRVRVISPRPWGEALHQRMRGRTTQATESARAAGIEVAYPSSWYPPGMMRERYGDFMWWSVCKAVQRMTRGFRPDAILSYWIHPDGEAAVRAARPFDVPVGVMAGGSDVLLLPQCPRRGERIKQVLRQTDAVLTVSDGLRQSVIDLGIEPDRVQTVYQGVDESIFYRGESGRAFHVKRSLQQAGRPLPDDRPLLLWVGRMVGVKRLDVLIDGIGLLQQQRRDVLLCLAGDGPERRKAEQRAAQRGLRDQVCFLGALPPTSLGDWYRAADLTVLTSDSEGLPNVLRESLACGTPFVSTDVGSIRELAVEPFGRLVPSGDPSTLAEAIAVALDRRCDDDASFPPTRTWDDTAGEIVDVLSRCGAVGKRTSGSVPVLAEALP